MNKVNSQQFKFHAKYPRLDYSAQCLNVQQFRTVSVGELCQETVSHGRALIVAKELAQEPSLDTSLNIAAALSRQGLKVDVLCCATKKSEVKRWVDGLARLLKSDESLSIDIKFLSRLQPILNSPAADLLSDSYHLYVWFKEVSGNYSIVYSIENSELLYYILLARKVLLKFTFPKFIVFSRSLYEFDLIKHSLPMLAPAELNLQYVQREVVGMCDCFLSNSDHLLNWLNEANSNRAPLAHFDPPVAQSTVKVMSFDDTRSLKVLVLSDSFQRVEFLLTIQALLSDEVEVLELEFCMITPTKGLVPSRDVKKALDSLSARGHAVDSIGHLKTDWTAWVDRILSVDIVIIPCIEAIPACLVSLIRQADVKLLENGLFEDPEQGYQLRTFNHNPGRIVTYLTDALTSLTLSKLKSDHLSFRNFSDTIYRNECGSRFAEPDASRKLGKAHSLTVSVCIAHYNRPKLIKRAVNSILGQSQACLEIIIVDDGSTDRDATQVLDELSSRKEKIPIRVIRQKNAYLGASRNRALAEAKGDYVLFMDDDNEAKPEEIECFVRAAVTSQADILTCLSDVFMGSSPKKTKIQIQRALYVGPNISIASVSNPYGDSNMFAKADSLISIGGFSEHYKVGRDDLEMFVRAQRNGLRIELIPESLYYYRLSENRMRMSHLNLYAGHARVLASLTVSLSQEDSMMIRYGQGLGYAAGPWGVSMREVERRTRLVERVRLLVAKYPTLYHAIARIRVVFRGD